VTRVGSPPPHGSPRPLRGAVAAPVGRGSPPAARTLTLLAPRCQRLVVFTHWATAVSWRVWAHPMAWTRVTVVLGQGSAGTVRVGTVAVPAWAPPRLGVARLCRPWPVRPTWMGRRRACLGDRHGGTRDGARMWAAGELRLAKVLAWVAATCVRGVRLRMHWCVRACVWGTCGAHGVCAFVRSVGVCLSMCGACVGHVWACVWACVGACVWACVGMCGRVKACVGMCVACVWACVWHV
jgi:hypothetical protein